MTDRLNGLTVVFDGDYREDDVQSVIDAICMIKGVLKVTPQVSNHNQFVAETRVRMEITEKIWDALKC